MKKLLLTAIFMSALSASLFAGGVDNKTNLNAGYERNPSRNTEHKRPEAVFYNIGGIGFMEDGLYFEAGNQFVIKNYANELNNPMFSTLGINNKYEDKKLVYLYPNAEVVYKKGNLALFFGFGVFGGGGNLEYKDGTAATALAFAGQGIAAKNAGQNAKASLLFNVARNHTLDVYSVQLGEIVGISGKILDNLSLAVAARFMHGTQTIDLASPGLIAMGNGSDTVGYKADGYSVGAMFGVHYKPIEKLDVSAQYQSITRLNYEYHSFTGNQAIIGQIITNKKDNFANDLPAVLNLGVGYQFLDPLYASMSFNYYFNHFAKIESPMSGEAYDYGNSWEIALGADYEISDSWLVSAGFSYGRNGTTKTDNNIFSPVLDSFVVGAGCEYKFAKMFTATASLMYCKYFGRDFSVGGYNVDLTKNVTMVALGITCKPF